MRTVMPETLTDTPGNPQIDETHFQMRVACVKDCFQGANGHGGIVDYHNNVINSYLNGSRGLINPGQIDLFELFTVEQDGGKLE